MLSKDDVKYIAHLARIHLREDEVTRLTKDLESILLYVTKLEKLDVKEVAPTSHVLPIKNVYREDKVKPSLKQSDAMNIAVASHNGFFKVPQVIE